jgi:radical SAM-linked protein
LKIRVKFSKTGVMKFIGHLDVMRYFQKAIRRAGIDIRYSEGYSPHQIMSFAAPLGLGDTSECEYMDIDVASWTTSEDMKARLNAVMAEGIEILSCRMLPEGCKNAMASMAAADYRLSFRPGYEPEDPDSFWAGLAAFVEQPEILVLRKTKKSEKEVDIRPYILSFSLQDGRIFCRVTAGSSNNLKPERIVEAYCQAAGIALSPFALEIHRIELYAQKEDQTLVSLEDLGEEF